MPDNKFTIICPKCHEVISVDEALSQQLQQEALAKLRAQHQQELENIKKEATKVLAEELKIEKEEKQQLTKKLDEALGQELLLRKQKNDLEIAKKTFEAEKQRQLDSEREKIRMKTMEEIADKQRLKDKEKDLMIEGLKKSLDEAQRKASQGSQQLQGEVQELDLEQELQHAFPQDLIEPIGKGVLGADVRQTVRSPMGINCGTILWESKRTKFWSNDWINKLKNDVLNDKANIPAIVTETIPDEAKNGIGIKNGVWIASPKLTVILAALLRKSLLDVAKQRKIAQNKQSKAEDLYTYIMSDDFANQVKSMLETYDIMAKQIQDERTAFERIWKKREIQIVKLKSGVSGMYGSIEEISGKSLPQVKNLELPEK